MIGEKKQEYWFYLNSSGVAAILGQEGFFDAFRIKFERDHGIVEVTFVKT